MVGPTTEIRTPLLQMWTHLGLLCFIIKVVLCKFHSVLLSDGGDVLTCGHGPGGRLGHDSEQSVVVSHIMLRSLDSLLTVVYHVCSLCLMV